MAGTSLEKHPGPDGQDEHTGEDRSVVAHGGSAPVRYNPDAPSEAWGWHGEWRLFAGRGSRVLMLAFAAVMFLMLIGNHVSRVEDWYLVLIGLGMLVWIGAREATARRRRRHRP